MSPAAHMSAAATTAPGIERRPTARFVLVIALVVALAAAAVLITVAAGDGTQNTVASGNSRGSDMQAIPQPFPGLARQAREATPRSVPPVRTAPTRGSLPIRPRD